MSDEVPAGGGSGPTVRRMLLGAQLRRLRSEAGLSREQAGAAIRASEWKIHIYVMESISLRSAPPHRTPDIHHRILRENEAG